MMNGASCGAPLSPGAPEFPSDGVVLALVGAVPAPTGVVQHPAFSIFAAVPALLVNMFPPN